MDACENNVVYSKCFEFKSSSNEKSLATIVSQVKAAVADSLIPHDQFLGIGLGMPGFVNIEEGSNQCYDFSEGSLNLRKYLQERFSLPVVISNDSSTIALGETKFDKAKGKLNVMVVILVGG